MCWDFYSPKLPFKNLIYYRSWQKNSIKCLSLCYCGMSMEFSVVFGAAMTGGSQIQLMILD